MIRQIETAPADVLRQKAEKVKEITPEINEILTDLADTMVSGDGVGIAAPQINHSLQIALVQLEPEDELLELINPVIISASGSDIFVEGCLSIPNVYGTVERSEQVTVDYVDCEGYGCQLTAEGYLARVIQHEIDHLNGILFTDKMIEQIDEADLEIYYQKYEAERIND